MNPSPHLVRFGSRDNASARLQSGDSSFSLARGRVSSLATRKKTLVLFTSVARKHEGREITTGHSADSPRRPFTVVNICLQFRGRGLVHDPFESQDSLQFAVSSRTRFFYGFTTAATRIVLFAAQSDVRTRARKPDGNFLLPPRSCIPHSSLRFREFSTP